MSELKKEVQDATRAAMFEAGKDAAKRAALDLIDDDDSAADKQGAEGSMSTRNKLIVMAVLAVCVVIGVLGMLMSYWHWFLALGLAGLAGLYLRRRWRAHRASKREEEAAQAEADRVEETARQRKAASERAAQEEAKRVAAEAEAEADAAQAIEDELQALKARVES